MGRTPGSVIYTAVLNDRGTFESDLIAQRIAKDHYRLFVGTTSIDRDLNWLRNYSYGFGVSLTDSTEDYAVIGLMGPESARILAETGAPELNDFGYFKVGPAHIARKFVRAARMSYVGELGWEITTRTEDAGIVYDALHAAGARPAGLYAQTSMRIEKSYCAMGHELDGDITPIEAGLAFATRKSGGFIGAEALVARLAEGAVQKIVALRFVDINAVPLGREPIYADGRIVGQTSSAAFGFRIDAPVALGHAERLVDRQRVQVDISRILYDAYVSVGPLFDPKGERMRAC